MNVIDQSAVGIGHGVLSSVAPRQLLLGATFASKQFPFMCVARNLPAPRAQSPVGTSSSTTDDQRCLE
ncbi:hypothetical protein [Geminicoccus harenae]|uniref:hypothetical protein n=1 Tax=Geminicoccus harenae TaxID=2498453 RepID=UPI001C93FFB5|nr:hypothetical protein [Geminicoccus harenae]